jgi:hypothetical protein
MDLFAFWLKLESTLATVVVPLLIGVVGFAAMSIHSKWRRELLPQALRLVLLATLCIPLMHATSFWSADGLHIAPLDMAPLLYLVVTQKLDVRRQWFAVGFASWFCAVVPDVLGAWMANYPGSTWYWSVGGAGYGDGLFVGPLVGVCALFLVQGVLHRRWLQAHTWGLVAVHRGAV